MSLKQKTLLIVTLVGAFILIFAPHLGFPYPYHVDEWHHISESIRLGNYGEYFEVLRGGLEKGFSGEEIGFHSLLFLTSFVSNLVLVYKFLPAIWVVLSSLAIFYVVYKKTKGNFLTAWLSIIFFIAIRSNVNITGLWFFTPLTFSIPLIFLYFYFFSEGIQRQSRKMILISLGIMAILMPTHSISVLFAIPALLIYALISWRYVIKEYKVFLAFIVIPLIGLAFYKYTLAVPWNEVVGHLLEHLQFKHGWGVLELKNSFLETYSGLGYLLAIIGVASLAATKGMAKKYALYLLWPITVLISIIIYRSTGVSYLSPYQRNIYYLTIGLPILSAVGLKYIIDVIKAQIEKAKDKQIIPPLKEIATIILILVAVVAMFKSYYRLPNQVDLYRVIDKNDYQALVFMSQFSKSKIMSTPFISTAVYPISGHSPVGSTVFYGDRTEVEDFFFTDDCGEQQKILDKNKAEYVITKWAMDCEWDLIYKNKTYIYKNKILK